MGGAEPSRSLLEVRSRHDLGGPGEDLGRHLNRGAMVMIYGPFKYQGKFTTESNADFDRWLKDADPERGIRDFEQLDRWFRQAGLKLVVDISMPANNQILLYEKT